MEKYRGVCTEGGRCKEVKKEIRSILLAYHEGIPLEGFSKAYRKFIGQSLPTYALGFISDLELLKSMDDVVKISIDQKGNCKLFGIADLTTCHLQSLVSRQKRNKPVYNFKKSIYDSAESSFISHQIYEQSPLIPAALRSDISHIMVGYPNGISFPSFVLAYMKMYKTTLPCHIFKNLEKTISAMPELEIKTVNDEKKIFCCYHSSKPFSVLDKSGVSEAEKCKFVKVLNRHRDGMLAQYFPDLYELYTGDEFDIHSYGYISLLELVDALPNVFSRNSVPGSMFPVQWMLCPAGVKNTSEFKDIKTLHSMHTQLLSKRKKFPSDVQKAIPRSVEYMKQIYSHNVDGRFGRIFISSVLDPWEFWFQLVTETSRNCELEELDKELQSFYNSPLGDKYKMKPTDIVSGASCVFLCPDDQEWYRGLIKSASPIEPIRVEYVDYGMVLQMENPVLRYPREDFCTLPMQAFKAKLANLKPANSLIWSNRALTRFIELSNCKEMIISLLTKMDDVHFVFLSYFDGTKNISVNYLLIKEGYAEFDSTN